MILNNIGRHTETYLQVADYVYMKTVEFLNTLWLLLFGV